MKEEKIIEYVHSRPAENVKRLLELKFGTREELESDRFAGQIQFTPLGVIVSEWDGENQYQLICNGDQSGMGEVVFITAPVDSPLEVIHSKIDGWNTGKAPLNDIIDEFLLSISTEANFILSKKDAIRRW